MFDLHEAMQISMIMHWRRIPYSDIGNKTVKKDNWSWFG
jgi:hypothetical protein